MLKFMRRNASGAWVKVMFLLIVGVFVFWGFGVGMDGATRVPPVATVNDETIDELDFQRAYTNLLRMYQDIYKDQMRPELLASLDLKGKAVDQLVRVALLRQEAERLGLQASDSEIRDSIATMTAFQQNGRFDKDLYVRVLRNNSLSPGEFEDSKRQELLVGKLQELILAGVHVSETDARARYDFENEKIDLKFVEFTPAGFLPQVAVTDDEVKQYYDAHPDTFREPNKVRVEYALYTADTFLPKVEVADTDVKAYYDGHQQEFSRPERVRARHILARADESATDEAKAAARKKAEDLLAKANAGEDFEALAKAHSEDPGSGVRGGDLGFFPRGQMVPAFEAVAFSLAPGSISEIVETPFGFHIIKVEEKQEAHTSTIDEAREAIVTKLKREQAHEMARAQANADQPKVVAGQPLATVAQASGITANTPAPFAEQDAVEGLGSGPLSRAAFTVELNGVGPVVDAAVGFVVFRVTEKLDAHLPELALVKARAEDALRKEKAAALAQAKADGLFAEAQKSDLDTAAQAAGLTVDESVAIARGGNFFPKIGASPELKKVAFDLTSEKPLAPAVYKVDNKFVVVALKQHIAADDKAFGDQKAALTQQAETLRKNQVMEEFLNYLKARATVELNDKYLASLGEGGRPTTGTR